MGKDNRSHNHIPFKNLDFKQGREAPKSPYMEFFEGLGGYIVFDRKHRTEVLRYDLWAKYNHSQRELNKILRKEHQDYVFINIKDWNQTQLIDGQVCKEICADAGARNH